LQYFYLVTGHQFRSNAVLGNCKIRIDYAPGPLLMEVVTAERTASMDQRVSFSRQTEGRQTHTVHSVRLFSTLEFRVQTYLQFLFNNPQILQLRFLPLQKRPKIF